MTLRDRLQIELVTRRMQVHAARVALRKEEKDTKMPAQVRDRYLAHIRLLEGNVDSCAAALEAVCKYPPIRI